MLVTSRPLPITSLLCFSVASACSASDGIWFPPEESGKADAFTTIRGTDIPSAYVDATKSYVIARRINSLDMAGALNATESRLAARVDGIIANMPSDGKLHLAELVRMEDPSIFESLFPDEAAALPGLWKKVEAPSANDLVVGPDVTLGVLDVAAPPGAAVPPASLTITSLESSLQSAATRLQNVYNADNNAATVMLADVDNGIANPSPFTQAEVDTFVLIRSTFIEKAVATSHATLVVSPGPGAFSHAVTLGPIGLSIAGTTQFDEERVFNGSFTARFTASQNLSTTATLAQDAKVLVLHKESRTEAVFGAGMLPSIAAGPAIVEVWQSGQRTFSTNAVLPETTRAQVLDLLNNLDYTLKVGATTLVRNTASATMMGTTFTTKFTYDKTAVPPMGMLNASALQNTATPTITIPVGRYSFPQYNTTVFIYPGNVIWVEHRAQLHRLLPYASPGLNRFRNAVINARFDTPTNDFYLNFSGTSFSVKLTASGRDI